MRTSCAIQSDEHTANREADQECNRPMHFAGGERVLATEDRSPTHGNRMMFSPYTSRRDQTLVMRNRSRTRGLKLIRMSVQPAALAETYRPTMVPRPMLSIFVRSVKSRTIFLDWGISRFTSSRRTPVSPAVSLPEHFTMLASLST